MQNKVLRINDAQAIRHEITKCNCGDKLDELFRALLGFYNIANVDFNWTGNLVRVRRCEGNTGYPDLRDIYYPPPEKTVINRLNEQGQPFLYLSFEIDTALQEMEAKEGDLLQVGFYKVKDNSKLRVGLVGEVKSSFHAMGHCIGDDTRDGLRQVLKGASEKDMMLAKSIVYLDAFFEQILRDKDAKQNDYKHSRALSRQIFQTRNYVDALIYHSVANSGAKNIAMPATHADRLIELERTLVIKVNKVCEYGLYDWDIHSVLHASDGSQAVWEPYI